MANLVIFDWDWTLARPESGETFRRPGEKYVWMNGERYGRVEVLEWLHNQGNDIAIATNQGGIAFGLIQQDEAADKMFALLKDLSFFVPFLICPYHEKYPSSYSTYCHWRKPLPGMLRMLHALFPNVPANKVLVVGDRFEDEGAALNAGFVYHHAMDYFREIEAEMDHEDTLEITGGL
jgi:HAD superfamily hydrolase (TIGR01662 family)